MLQASRDPGTWDVSRTWLVVQTGKDVKSWMEQKPRD